MASCVLHTGNGCGVIFTNTYTHYVKLFGYLDNSNAFIIRIIIILVPIQSPYTWFVCVFSYVLGSAHQEVAAESQPQLPLTVDDRGDIEQQLLEVCPLCLVCSPPVPVWEWPRFDLHHGISHNLWHVASLTKELLNHLLYYFRNYVTLRKEFWMTSPSKLKTCSIIYLPTKVAD